MKIMIASLQVNIPAKPAQEYPILINSGLLKNWNSWLPKYLKSNKIVIISDDKVKPLYADKLSEELNSDGYQAKLITFPNGEHSKSIITKLKLEEEMFSFGCDRHTLCLALGGGVVGDLTGFTAATYMRGIDYVQIPTSLLAMIDSSVGGKTGINNAYGKNNIGAFYQPKAVIMDTSLLSSLPREHIVNGFLEAIKIFATLDTDSYEYCCNNLESILNLEIAPIKHVIEKAVALKAQVVEIDEHEVNLRMILNFGHSVGHAIEKLSNYEVLHGYAVGIGMLVEAKVAQLSGTLSVSDFLQLTDLLSKLGITKNLITNYEASEVIRAMRGDKKNINQQISLILLSGIGSTKNIANKVSFPVEESLIIEAFNALKENI